MTNGGETNVTDMFKHSMGKGKDEILKNGAGTDDLRKFLQGVVKANKATGIRVGFKWKKMIGVIDRVAGPFNVQSLRTRVLSRENSYVFLGRAKGNNEVHAKMMKSMKGEDEEAQFVCWGMKATGGMVADHAIGLIIHESQSMLYDNGFTGGSKDFSIENMAGRMIDVSACFVFDLFELKMDFKV